MTQTIHADPQKFRQVAQELRRISAELREGGGHLLLATSDARSYGGQYAPWLNTIASEGDRQLRAESEKLESLASKLEGIARAFELADQLESRGMPLFANHVRSFVERGFDISTFPLWLRQGQRPSWVSSRLWNRLPLDDREAILQSISSVWFEFIQSGDYDHGSNQDTLNAFQVHLFLNNLVTETPKLDIWKSAAKAAGLSVEEYVMRVLNITAYDRDTVAGAGVTETREVGPIAVILVGQSLINTTRSYELKGMDYYGFKKYANDIDFASDRYAGWGEGYKNKDQAAYLQLALDGDSLQNRINPYTHEKLVEEEDLLTPLASAAQDSAWRLLAGYEVGDVTLFLYDDQSEWWTYYQSMVDQGYAYPYSMDEVMGMVEKSYFYNNEYEGNVDNCWLEPINPEKRIITTKYEYDIASETYGYQLAAESLITIRGLGANNFGLVTHTEIGPILGGPCR